MYEKNQNAFTMIELVFVIVVIGILSAVAIPKFAATRDDAVITKAMTTIASVRSALSTERQKRILRGEFDPLTAIDTGTANAEGDTIFDHYDGDVNESLVLQYPITSCSSATSRGCWIKTAGNTYNYRMPHNANDVTFTVDLTTFRMTCDDKTGSTKDDCIMLTK